MLNNGPILEYLPWGILPLCLTAIAYYGYVLYAAADFFGQSTPVDPDFAPPVTLLKPLCGLDASTYENLASFCRQEYPTYQIVFAVREATDPVIAIAHQLIQDFPAVDLKLVVSDRVIGANLKVSNLDNAVAHAKYDTLVLADSDIRVGPDYLQRVVQPLQDEAVGVVTCLYKSLVTGWLAAFEALGIVTWFHPRVLSARHLEGMQFAMGSTIVLRQAVLRAIGGFGAIANHLADDCQIGYLAVQAGYKVVLSDYIVEHQLAHPRFTDVLHRQVRWARCIRVERFRGYLGLLLTQGTAVSLLFLLATQGSPWGWTMLTLVWSLRLAMAWRVGVHYLKDPVARQLFWLVPVRDLCSFAIWCYSLVGNTIVWRDQTFMLLTGGTLVPVKGDRVDSLQLEQVRLWQMEGGQHKVEKV